MIKVFAVEGFGRNNVNGEFRPWHDYQRWLAAGERRVFIPFAKTPAKLIRATKSMRLWRDFGQLLRAIKAHALLHREQRIINREEGIVATIEDDYFVVAKLMGEMLATASEIKAGNNILETVEAVKALSKHRDGVKKNALADKLNMDKSTAYRRLRAAEDQGYIVNLEYRKGRAGRYICAEETPPVSVELLPPAVELMKAHKQSIATAKTSFGEKRTETQCRIIKPLHRCKTALKRCRSVMQLLWSCY